MSESRYEQYKRYSLGYDDIAPRPELFEKYILSNFPKDKDLIERYKHDDEDQE